MTLRSANGARTVCEVLREINDVMQGEPKHLAVLAKLREAEAMCKKMALKLYDYNKNYDKGWWDANPDYEEDLKRRTDETDLS